MVAGVDSSTQSCKIVVCELESGQIVRTGRAAHPDGTEVSAAAWLRAFEEATADPGLLEDVQALAVGGQQHGMVTLDESGERYETRCCGTTIGPHKMRPTSSPN